MLAIVAFLAVQISVSAAVGDEKKKKRGSVLRVDGFELNYFGKHSKSLYARPGTFYRYNFATYSKAPQNTNVNEYFTYKKGNTVYILPQSKSAKIPLSKFKMPEKPQQ